MSTTDALTSLATSVVVHPLVLLSIQDHAARAAKGTKKRVVGILLGQDMGAKGINVANSFAGTFSGAGGKVSEGEGTSFADLTCLWVLPALSLVLQFLSKKMTRILELGS